MEWYNFRKVKGKSVQGYTIKSKKRATLLGVSLKIDEILLKYMGGLHSYLFHTILLFKPTDLDEVCVQLKYLEEHGRIDREDYLSKIKPHGKDKFFASYRKEDNKKKRWHYSHCDKDGHTKDGCWKLHPDRAPQWFYQGKKNTHVMFLKELEKSYEIEDSSIIDENLAFVGLKLPGVVNAEEVSVHMQKEELKQEPLVM